ncbi:hypothetical protein M5D96_000491, partial [Drosophila gunungcola]
MPGRTDMGGGQHFWHSFCGLADMCLHFVLCQRRRITHSESSLATKLRSLCPQKELKRV